MDSSIRQLTISIQACFPSIKPLGMALGVSISYLREGNMKIFSLNIPIKEPDSLDLKLCYLCLNSWKMMRLGKPCLQIRIPSRTPLHLSWSKTKWGSSFPDWKIQSKLWWPLWKNKFNRQSRNFTVTVLLICPSQWLCLHCGVGPLDDVMSFDHCITVVSQLWHQLPKAYNIKEKKRKVNMKRARSWSGIVDSDNDFLIVYEVCSDGVLPTWPFCWESHCNLYWCASVHKYIVNSTCVTILIKYKKKRCQLPHFLCILVHSSGCYEWEKQSLLY